MSEHAKLSPSSSDRELSQERLKQLLDYNPTTGIFTWKVWRGGSAKAGTVAGKHDSRGYIQVTVEMRAILAHRLAVFYMTGVWPLDEVDHRDGVRTNNAWLNLRAATHSQNQQNKAGAPCTNKSTGLVGATWDAGSGKYLARIAINGKNKNLGRFPTAAAAHECYLSAKAIHHSHVTRLLGA